MTRDAREGRPPAPVSVQVRSALSSEAAVGRGSASSSPSVQPPDGTPLWSGRIRPLEEVGSGASGTVRRGMDTKLRREVAIKVTASPREKMPTALLARFVEEAQITAQLEHPNVVPVHDLGVDPEGRAYFSMKLVRGQSLEAILDKRKAGDAATLSEFGLRRLLDVFLQVCQAVDYAHARGVIHRDLKPANIMVGDFGEVLVMDWGVAKLLGRDEPASEGTGPVDVTSVRAGNQALATQHGAVLGTPAYMAPEQARGKNVDERADVYSLGVILYEILCGDVPFDAEDPVALLARVVTEAPRPPSAIAPNVPPALEMLTLRLLEKESARRTITIRQIRSHVQDYIEGIGHEYRRERLWTTALWIAGALGLFAFLVWYLTGQSIATVVALTPATAFNAVGWMLVVMAMGYPLWGATASFATSRAEHDPFRPPTSEELFVSGYLSHRTLAAAIAPLFQLVFIVEIFATALSDGARHAASSQDVVQNIAAQLRAEWAHALIVAVVFLFAYLFLLSAEVRFARRLDRYLLLSKRARWESVWPVFLVVVVLGTMIAAEVLDSTAASGRGPDAWSFLRDRVLTRRLEAFEIVKTLVFQGTFLLGLVAANILLAFPLGELLAALRMVHQPVDEAFVSSRREYFMRSLAVVQVAKATWLYGGTMIGGLTALTMLSGATGGPLVERFLYILGPALIGFTGFALTRRWAGAHLASAPAVQRMVDERLAAGREEHAAAVLDQLRTVPWRRRLLQAALPVACIVGYLLWTGSGVHQEAIRKLMMPVSAKGWLLILPYALLVPLLLVRDPIQLVFLRRRVGERRSATP